MTSVEPWPEVERRFREDPRWLGGDDAYSIPLGDGRHLWLFGDTFIARDGGGRSGAHFLNNSVAIQAGDDPETATFTMRWRADEHGQPRSLFLDDEPGVYLWPAHGAVVEGRLLLFFMRIRNRREGEEPAPDEAREGEAVEALSNFRVVGWSARLIRDPSGDPLRWADEAAALPRTEQVELVGAATLVEDGYLITHALAERGGRTEVVLVRWPVAAAASGDLTDPGWWGGAGWVADERHAVATGLPPLTEFTVHRDQGRYVAIGMMQPRNGRLQVRTAAALWGPWSDPEELYRPPLAEDPEVLHYAGKAHPGHTDGLLVTYASNATTLEGVLRRDELYYPHCLRVRRQPS